MFDFDHILIGFLHDTKDENLRTSRDNIILLS